MVMGTWEMQQLNYEASAVFVAPDGCKWFTAGFLDDPGGVLVLSSDGRSWHYHRADLHSVNRITGDAAGNLWFMTWWDGVIELTPGQ